MIVIANLGPICKAVGPTLAFLSIPWPIIEKGLVSRRSISELAELVPFPYCIGNSTRYHDTLYDFSVTMSR